MTYSEKYAFYSLLSLKVAPLGNNIKRNIRKFQHNTDCCQIVSCFLVNSKTKTHSYPPLLSILNDTFVYSCPVNISIRPHCCHK